MVFTQNTFLSKNIQSPNNSILLSCKNKLIHLNRLNNYVDLILFGKKFVVVVKTGISTQSRLLTNQRICGKSNLMFETCL